MINMKKQFLYRLKILLKDKALIFWTLFFPMILATFFNVSLREAYKNPPQKIYNVAVVNTDESFQTFLNSLETDHQFLKQTAYTDYQSAVAASENNSFDAIIVYQDIASITFSSNDYSSESTIISNVFQQYNTKKHLIETELKSNPTVVTENFINDIMSDTKYVTTVSDEKSSEMIVIHFYSAIAMLCIYASQRGNRSAQYLQADMSAIGIRNNISPTSKSKMVLIDVAAIFTIFAIEFCIFIIFLKYLLNAPFGNNFMLIVLTGVIGGLLTSMFGYMMCVVIKGGEGKRSTIISMVGIFMSFLSGMMATNVKFLVDQHLPLLAKINPAALITDNFYWIYMNSHEHVIWENLTWMLGLTIVFGIIAFSKLRRTTYDHI